MPRFVILTHDHPELHWDLMLEAGPALRTWRLAEPPETGKTIAATALGDHRLAYLDYEGPVSGGRGRVARWDAGEYRVQTWTDDQIRIEVEGGKTRGIFQLSRNEEIWTFEYRHET